MRRRLLVVVGLGLWSILVVNWAISFSARLIEEVLR